MKGKKGVFHKRSTSSWFQPLKIDLSRRRRHIFVRWRGRIFISRFDLETRDVFGDGGSHLHPPMLRAGSGGSLVA